MKKAIFFTTLFLLSFLAYTPKVEAHAVQLGYCASCNNVLRLWVEHWHTTSSPSTTTMTISVTVNGVTTTTTGSPLTNIQNVPKNQLPGCANPITVIGACNGTGIYQANSHNDWVNYDFPGVPCGVPVSITVISGNNAFTMDACNMMPATTGTFTIPCGTPTVGAPNQTVCVGDTFTSINFPPLPGITYTWNNSNPAIGLPATGTGSIPSFVAQNNTTAPITAICTVFYGCVDSAFTLTVNPAPQAVPYVVPFCMNTPVTLVDSSQTSGFTGPITNWYWDIGNNGIIDDSTQSPPNQNFTGPGPFNIKLTVIGTNGCKDDSVISVTPAPPPIAQIGQLVSCPNTPMQLYDSSISPAPISTWQWDIGNNGTVDYTTQNPTHTFPAAGWYQVKLVVSSGLGCNDTIVDSVMVAENPTASFVTDSVCVGFPTTLTDQSTVNGSTITNWIWKFGDGSPNDSTGTPVTHTYPAANISPGYSTQVVAISAYGCKDSINVNVPVYPLPTANFTITNACVNYPATFTDNSVNGVKYSWDFGDGNNSTNVGTTTHTYTVPGMYNVQLIVESGTSCPDTFNATVAVHPSPVADFNFTNMCDGLAVPFNNTSNISSGTIASWDWNYGDGSTHGNTQNSNHLYAACGTYNVTLIANSDSGCADTVTKTIEVYPNPVADFSVTEECLGFTTQFTDNSTIQCNNVNGSIVNYNWSFGDGNNSGAQNPTHNYISFGNYNGTLIVTSNYGCKDSITKPVNVYDNPPSDFVSDTNGGCAPVCVTFTANGGTPATGMSYLWNYGDDSNVSGINATHCFQNNSLSTKYFNVTLTTVMDYGTKQCTTVTTKNNFISAYPQPIAEFSWSPDILNVLLYPEAKFKDMSLGGASQWTWSFGDGDSSTTQHPYHVYKDSGDYIVWLHIQTQYGCTDSTWKKLRVEPEFAVYIPNTFTPDGDGINDYFTFKGFGLEEATMMIFDRWGELIYEEEGVESKWDGRVKGKEIGVTDVYVYRIEVKNVKGDYHTYVGKVTLLK